MILVILSAGRGSRLKHHTQNVPKSLVRIKNIPIIDYMERFRNKFEKTIIVTGYKDKLIKNKFKRDNKISLIKNNDYKKTNMVYSLFKIQRKDIKNKNIVVAYSDIIFDPKIYKNLTLNRTMIPINKNWKNLWKKRMNLKKIREDAEDLKVKNKIVISIGEKIKHKLPRYQFMGLIKILNSDYFKLKKYFKRLDKKIDFTSFLNKAISNNIIKLYYKKTSNFWFEVDNEKDLKIVEKFLR